MSDSAVQETRPEVDDTVMSHETSIQLPVFRDTPPDTRCMFWLVNSSRCGWLLRPLFREVYYCKCVRLLICPVCQAWNWNIRESWAIPERLTGHHVVRGLKGRLTLPRIQCIVFVLLLC